MEPAADSNTLHDGQGKNPMDDTSSKKDEKSKSNTEPVKIVNYVVVPKELIMLQVIKQIRIEDKLVTERK